MFAMLRYGTMLFKGVPCDSAMTEYRRPLEFRFHAARVSPPGSLCHLKTELDGELKSWIKTLS